MAVHIFDKPLDNDVNSKPDYATEMPISDSDSTSVSQAIAKLPILKKISISGTTDANGDIGISGLSQATYPIAFLAGTNSSDVVTFFDGSQTSGYQKYAHFNSRKSVAVSGDVIYLEGTLIE